ncbi:MAG: AAA family ATPase, partial [Deltaproteobacteria bacterium]|nr:AAA family ATPase [Deltaproteobacteria bacterium]
DITFDKNFSTICGFTKNEITSYYGKYLERSLAEFIDEKELPHDSTADDIMSKITEWYDGYSWDGKKKVLNPFSIKNFLDTSDFQEYWYDSGTSLFTNILDSFDGNHFSIFGKKIIIEAPLKIQDTSNINDEAFLLQAGYLTVETIVKSHDSKSYCLAIPNKEIRNAINKELSAKFQSFVKNLQFIKDAGDPLAAFSSMKDRLLASLWSCDENLSEMLISSIFSGNPKEWYNKGGEGSFKLILMTIMRFGGAVFTGNMLEALGEVYSDAGRADLLLDVHGKGYIVLEVKHLKAEDSQNRQDVRHHREYDPSRPEGSELPDNGGKAVFSGLSSRLKHGIVTEKIKRILEKQVNDAFNQILVKNYAKQYLASGKPVRAAAIAVYGTSDVMVRFAEIIWNASHEKELDIREIPLPAPKDHDRGS